MSDSIKTECLSSVAAEITGKEVLPGEIAGLASIYYTVPKGDAAEVAPADGMGLVALAVGGSGEIQSGSDSFTVNETAFFAPVHGTGFSLKATSDAFQCLVLVIDLGAEDLAEIEKKREHYPFFMSYSQCKTYKEKIKSEKTVNRTLLPVHIFPRLCIGSVETTGKDHVAAHEHPMLEQLFYGLKDNDCVVHADDLQTQFAEDVLLHIPLGSSHSVDVEEGRKLHYIWIDLFKDASGASWIEQEHEDEE